MDPAGVSRVASSVAGQPPRELSRARLEGWGGGPGEGDDADEETRPDVELEREAHREEDGRREAIRAENDPETEETDPDRDARLAEFVAA